MLLLLLLAGCGPSTAGLRSNLAKGSFDMAVAEAQGDPELEDHLAAIVLERDAVENPSGAYELVTFLAASGAPGRRSLKVLEGGEGIGATLAWIALNRSSRPRGGKLSRLISDDSWDVRAYAASTWARKLDPQRLRELVLDKDPRVRRAAVFALAAAGREKDAELLAETLRLDPDPAVRMAIARKGEVLGKGALESLRDALEDESPGVGNAALVGLSRLGNDDATTILEDIASGRLDERAVVAAAALRSIGSETGARRFDEALGHENPGVRATAIVNLSLARIEDRRERLVEALGDESQRVVFIAASILLPVEEARGTLIEALAPIASEGGASAPRARDMLAVLGDPESTEEIRGEMEGWEEGELIERLRRLRGAPGLRDRVVDLLADERREVRIAAARCLLRSGRT